MPPLTPLLPHEVPLTLTCPYNPAHQILPSKMTVHLVRCRRSNLDKNVEICPFNSSHHVKSEELNYHLKMCKDRKLVEEFVYFNQTKPKMPVAATKNLEVKEEEGEENWENELVEHSYNPLEATRKKNVLRKVEGVTPAARRQFRLDERKRLESLQKAEEEIAMEGLGKLLVSRPRELLMSEVQPGPSGVAGASVSPSSAGRGRGRGKKKEVNPEVLLSQEGIKPAPRGVAGVTEAPRMAGRGRIKWVSRFN